MNRHFFHLLLLVAVPSLLGCRSGEEPNWKEFAPEGHGFSVALPGIPSRESPEEQSRLGGMNRQRFTLHQEQAGVSYRIEYFDYPPNLIELLTRASGPTPDKLLFAASRTLAAELGGTVVDEARVSLSGEAGKEVRIEGPDGTVTRARFYLVGNRLYRLIVTGEKDEPSKERVRNFFDSFKLLEPGSSEDPV